MKLICDGLPRRQCLVLKYAALGLSEKETARAMGCGPYNVQSARAELFFRFHTNNITGAVAEGFRRGNLKYVPRDRAAFARRVA